MTDTPPPPVHPLRAAVRRTRATASTVMDRGETLLDPVVRPLVTATQRRRGGPSADDLLDHYRSGRFLGVGRWGRFIWMNPRHRAVVPLADRHIPRRVRQLHRSGKFTVTYDTAFAEVLHHCATVNGRSAGAKPWLTPEVQQSYLSLHERGLAHSAEAWRDGHLVGGEIGVAINGYFSADTTFHLEANASKVAFADLLDHLAARGFLLLDTQVLSRATTPFGARKMARAEFRSSLHRALTADVTFS